MKKILFTSILCSNFLFASNITFNDALSKTLSTNHELKVKELEIDKIKADLLNAKGSELGILTFNENITRTNNPLHVFGMKLSAKEATMGDFGFTVIPPAGTPVGSVAPDALNHPQTRINYETKLTYELPLFTGFKISSAKDMARLQVKASSAKYNYDKKQLSLEVLKAYNGAVAAKHFITAVKKAKKATTSFVHFANEMFKEGYVTQIDIDQANVYDLKINAMLLEANNKFSLAIAYLKFLTNDATITDVSDFKNLTCQTNDLAFLQQKALDSRDDLEWIKHNTNTMKEKIDFENAGNYPMIGTHFEYGFNDNKLENINREKDYYIAAIGLEYKIFDGLTTSSAVEKAKLDYAKMNHYQSMMVEGIKLQVEKALLNLKTQNSILEEKIKAEHLANQVLIRSEQMYKNQLIKMNDLLLEQANAQKAEAETIMAKYNQTIAVAELQLSLGKELQ